MLVIPSSSRDYIHVPLTSWSGDVADPTTLPVSLAITTGSAEPGEAAWTAATWTTHNGTHHARALFADLVANPQPGTTYRLWMRLTAEPEVPVLYSGPFRTM